MGARSLTALHTAVLLLVSASVVATGLLVFPETRPMLLEHFSVMRAGVYGTWAIGLIAFLAAPLLLVRDLGTSFKLRPRSIRDALFNAGGQPLERAVRIGLVGNAAVLLFSPLGIALGDHYTWPVFLAHVLGSVLVLTGAVVVSLARVRAIVTELTPAPDPSRVSFTESAGF